jgi:hypothetical protein
MDDSLPRRFFLQPTCPQQRQYEALRAVFIDGLSQKEVAHRYQYSHGAIRVMVRQFRAACASGTPPPFLSSPAADGRPPIPSHRPRPGRTNQRLPTPAR